MNHKLRILIWVVTAASIAPVAIPTPSALASLANLVKSSPASITLSKQRSSNSASCQEELRSRMGGNQIRISLNNISESAVSSTVTRFTGTGVQSRSDRNDSRNFSFSCTVDSARDQVSSLSYTFTGSTVFGSGSSFGSSSTSPSPHPMPTPTPLHW
jgi:hypothetical protein